MNNDRGIIKWQPFNNIIEEKYLIEKMILEKNKITKPILSSEQIEEIEQKIIESYYEQEIITIIYYQNGSLLKTTAKIQYIDTTYKKIYLNNQKILLFSQIIQII